MVITKRDGSKEQFDGEKIRIAITKAFTACNTNCTCESINEIMETFYKDFHAQTVEEIQDLVEKSLMKCGYYEVAKTYILYRKQRENIRNSKSHLTKTFNEMLSLDARDNDLSRENANIDGNAPMGLMLLFGSETAKDYTKRYLLNPKHSDMHDKGDFHIHDLNMYPCTFNCCHIGLKDLFKRGFSTGHGHIRTPQSIQTASALAAIVIQSNQNDMFGGQSLPTLEYDLAPYVVKTFIKRLYECIELALGTEFENEKIKNKCFSIYNNQNTLIGCIDELKSYLKSLLGDKTDYVVNKTIQMTDKDVYQSMEAFIHNMNTLNSRCLPKNEEILCLNIKSSRDLNKMSDIELKALKELITELYKTRTIPEVAKELSTTKKIMGNIFAKLNIKTRNRKEASDFSNERCFKENGCGIAGLYKDKIKNTQFEKYGCYAFNSIKQKETLIERYGVDNPMFIDSVKNKIKKNNLDKYGYEHTFQVPEFREKTKETLIKKYGCENVLCGESPIRKNISYHKSEKWLNRIMETRMKKYGGKFLDSPYLREKYKNTCMEKYGFNTYPLYSHVSQISYKQIEIADFIRNQFPDLTVELNKRGLMNEHKGLEIDIWIKELRLGIEYNGIYWHNKKEYYEDINENTINTKERLKDFYSVMNDFILIQIWEDDYILNPEQIKNDLIALIFDLKESI